MSTKGYSAPLTWDRLLELAAQGHDHYDAALTSTRARQLVASVREHFVSQPESLTRRTYDLERDFAAANARIAELARSVLTSDAGRDSAFDLIVEAHNERDAAFNALEAANARADAAERRVGITRALDRATKAEAERDQLAARVKQLQDELEQQHTLKPMQLCTPEERAVLEAMARAGIHECYDGTAKVFDIDQDDVCQAELANRATKAKK
jgi:hypothetical protein